MAESGRGLSLDRVAIGALTDVTLSARPCEVVCLSGPSGSGKSRLLRAVADLEAHQGEITLDGQPQQSMPAHVWRSQVMLVPAESQWWHDRVGDHFALVDCEHLADLGFDQGVMDWSVARISSGEKQRLSLLRALALKPRALLLDEPTANLDGDNIRRVEQWLMAWIARNQAPVLCVAHDPAQIERVASQHWRIQGGALVEA